MVGNGREQRDSPVFARIFSHLEKRREVAGELGRTVCAREAVEVQVLGVDLEALGNLLTQNRFQRLGEGDGPGRPDAVEA